MAAEAGRQSNAGLWARAQAVIPGGVNSPVRAFGSVGGGTPYFVARGQGAYVWDVEGRRYIDYVQSYGASILGHAHPSIVAAVSAAASAGTTFGAPTEGEVLLAEALSARMPGLEHVRLVSSGTEAVMSALRLARGVTGRSKVLKFAGCYHGHADALLAAGGSGIANQGLSGSAGVPPSAVADTIVAPFNVVPSLSDEVAVVVVEAVAANMGLVAPAPGFLAGLREACDRVGALLLFDELITGFRLGRGGATAWSGVRPDLWTFGKVIGGGLPVGAFGGSRHVMAGLAPVGPVYQAGTLSGNPLATAAGLAVLNELDAFGAVGGAAGSGADGADAWEVLAGRAARLADGLRSAIGGAGLAVQVPQIGPLIGIFFTDLDHPVANYDEARAAADNGRYAAFFRGMLAGGVALAPGPYEVLFPSLAHTDADIDQTVSLAGAVAAEMAAGVTARV
ncbi:MAG TPA: glutamate-1-semialdehyde 2,1-aminomutase [Acidimicrobiales bacterium]|nr:glutamate-1-semialdehyde 2,1-aminomutase [Acidimicrobiales bacterium]